MPFNLKQFDMDSVKKAIKNYRVLIDKRESIVDNDYSNGMINVMSGWGIVKKIWLASDNKLYVYIRLLKTQPGDLVEIELQMGVKVYLGFHSYITQDSEKYYVENIMGFSPEAQAMY